MRISFSGVLACGVLLACGSEVHRIGGNGGDGGSGAQGGGPVGGGGSTGTGIQPPPPPQGAGPGDGPGYAFEVTKLFMGGMDRNGAPNPAAWKQYGYDLDHRVSTESDPGVCKPSAGGSLKVHNDGNAGIDNAWGKTIWPLFLSFANDAEETVNAGIFEGEYTLLVQIETLGSQPSYVNLPARFFEGAPLGSVPHFDGTDIWPITAESLGSPPDLASSLWPFQASYLSQQTFVTSPVGSLRVTISMAGAPLVLDIGHAVVSAVLSPDRSSASQGIIAGVIPTEVLVDAMRTIAGSFSVELCQGTTVESLLDQLRAASDILQDGTQDPTKTCDGISIGLGFDAAGVQLGSVAPPAQPAPDPCAN
jgi:hypothetical protein